MPTVHFYLGNSEYAEVQKIAEANNTTVPKTIRSIVADWLSLLHEKGKKDEL